MDNTAHKIRMYKAVEEACATHHLHWNNVEGFGSAFSRFATKVAQLEDNLQAVSVHLNESHIARLDEASRIEMGFPHDFLLGDGVKDILYSGQYDNIEKR